MEILDLIYLLSSILGVRYEITEILTLYYTIRSMDKTASWDTYFPEILVLVISIGRKLGNL